MNIEIKTLNPIRGRLDTISGEINEDNEIIDMIKMMRCGNKFILTIKDVHFAHPNKQNIADVGGRSSI